MRSAILESLADYFDDDGEAIRFMRAFAGTTLKMPAMAGVERMACELRIVEALHGDPTTATVRRLSQAHGVPMRAVAKTFAKATGEGLKRYRTRCDDTHGAYGGPKRG